MFSRNEMITEILLRKYVRDKAKKIIQEKIDVNSPNESTGINVLEDLLKKIIPSLEEDYKKLTSDEKQRKSFRSHIINAIQNSLAPSRSVETDDNGILDLQEDIQVDVDKDNEIPDEEAFIDIENDKGLTDEEREEKEFGISGEDETGRNIAFRSYKKIQTNIIDSYTALANDKDRELFYDYLLTNIKLYFDKWEDELQSKLSEPTTKQYEDERKEIDSGETEGGLEGSEGESDETGISDEELDLELGNE
ncbi:hypothetical protein M0R19_03125 [Candidatus Pacearchaeota archaeon]|jgi:hypothetical protein|nr:hypothetical protein [Candidatus Pacearchaeota archaeon]